MHRRLAALAGVLLLAATVHAAPPAVTSADGRWRLVAEADGLTVFDAQGQPVLSLAAPAVSAVCDAATRRSFVVVFDSLPELWEISYDPDAEPIYQGLVHDYRLREGIAEPGFLNPRRTRLAAPLRDPGFDSSHAFVIARAPEQADGQAVLFLVQLDVRKTIAVFTQRGDPDTAAVRRVRRDEREILEVPDRRGGPALRIDPRAARLLGPP
ncbi:MAG: hypothetical protein MUF16_24890 [Burkholderiaceae bacterium]|nr:hypothetical protein [Burkholderiaceae bacterium]